ncbi:MAG: 30S ribosomal protein S15 [Candidatus Omnitrophica bacterium CG11_big_fil_rev_8_21_14_0_20_64_10]|nr:MAG: 30S ribosomal protein S15 [Candidatus Omnitrophica bacterium CG11_big_fil_rev_8_21_14_0_20_64_10]
MPFLKEEKIKVIETFRAHEKDTGSASVQVAVLTKRINHLTDHFKTHKKDHHSRRGLLRLVNQRRKLLGYLKRSDGDAYLKVVDQLSLRK